MWSLCRGLGLMFAAYVHKNDSEELKNINSTLVRTSIMAVELVSKSLKVVVMQTGGKG